jgi:outer membrane murein-binding lipoprotein Lpp
MNMLPETIDLLNRLASQVEELAASLPAMDVPEADLAAIAGEAALASDRLARIEERLAARGPVEADAVLA